MESNVMNKAIFLDRDGVINNNIFYYDTNEWESPRLVSEFQFIDGAIPAIKKLQDTGFLLFIVTNQPSAAKGKTTIQDLKKILNFCENELQKNGIKITKIYCSFNHPKSIIPELAKECKYRKPSAGGLLEAQQEFNLDMKNSWMIGDRDTDIECGKIACVNTIKIAPDAVLNIIKAVEKILST
jgi:D-glycero-D-manno-heptose 1,7-bisphosphate phosphatase